MSAVRPATSRQRRAAAQARNVRLGLVLSVWLAVAGAASAQSETAPTQQPVAPLAEPGAPPTGAQPPSPGQGAQQGTPPAFASGLVDKLGDLIKGSVDGIKGSVDSLSSTVKGGTQQTIQDINQGTVDTLSKLPVTGFATGHALCTRDNTGAPDCRIASDQLCQAKGYKAGRGLDVETAENCNPRIFLPGYQRKEGDCRTDNYVTRAACN
jgi:hypothetical protein